MGEYWRGGSARDTRIQTLCWVLSTLYFCARLDYSTMHDTFHPDSTSGVCYDELAWSSTIVAPLWVP